MYINTYNLTGQALLDAHAHNDRQFMADDRARRWNTPWRRDVRRLIAYLAVTRDPAWLDAAEGVVASWLPMNYSNLPHHVLIAALDEQGITPADCILS